MNRHLSLVFAAWLAAPLAAQAPDTPSTKPVPAPAPAPGGETDGRVNERAQSMRDQIETGRQVKSHVRIAVRLKNGNKLVGIVKDGRFVERVDGLRFVDANAQEKGAGIRLWYSGGARNYVFVPFVQFSEYQVLQRLSSTQVEEIEKEMQMDEAARATERAKQAAAKAAAKNAPGSEPAAGDGVEAPAKATESANVETPPANEEDAQRKAMFALVQAYPPAAGWGPLKRDEISHRKAVIGSNPSDAEKKFVEQFAEWQKAVTFFGLDAEVKTAESPDESKGGKSEGADARDKRRSSRKR